MPGGGTEGELGGMDGVRVGRINLDEPVRFSCSLGWRGLIGGQGKPILQIAHHRLEGKLVTLSEPYALLRTTPAPEEPTPKRARLSSPPHMGSSPEKARQEEEVREPRIEIVGLVRRKIVFSKRPEPLVTLSSEADMGA